MCVASIVSVACIVQLSAGPSVPSLLYAVEPAVFPSAPINLRSCIEISTKATSVSSDDDDDDDGGGDNGVGCDGWTVWTRRGLCSTQLTDRRARKPCRRWIAAASGRSPAFALPIGTPSTEITLSPGRIPAASARWLSGTVTTAISPPHTPYASRGVSQPRRVTV